MASGDKTSRVLIADGDERIREQLSSRLLNADVLCDCVASGKEALDHLRGEKYALLLLDLDLAPSDAHSVLEYIRGMQRDERPMVLATAARDSGRLADVDVVQMIIRKPLRLSEVTEMIGACMRARSHRLSSRTA